MFDDIICKYPLPLPEDTKGFIPDAFQTKDLECALDRYEIREDGTLWLRESDIEYTGGDKNGKTFSEKFGTVKETKVWWTHVKLTQSIIMYTYQHSDGEYDYWVEFFIEFVDGVINKINLKKFEVIDNSKRKEDNKKHIDKIKLRMHFESTLRYKLIYLWYNKSIGFTCDTVCRFGNFLSTYSWKLRYKLMI